MQHGISGNQIKNELILGSVLVSNVRPIGENYVSRSLQKDSFLYPIWSEITESSKENSCISEQHLNENMMGEKFTIHFEIKKKKIHLHLEVFWGVL